MIHSVPGAGTRYRATNTASGFGRFFVRRCFCCCFRELDVCGGPRENNEKSNIRVLFCFSPPRAGEVIVSDYSLKQPKAVFRERQTIVGDDGLRQWLFVFVQSKGAAATYWPTSIAVLSCKSERGRPHVLCPFACLRAVGGENVSWPSVFCVFCVCTLLHPSGGVFQAIFVDRRLADWHCATLCRNIMTVWLNINVYTVLIFRVPKYNDRLK